MLDNQNSITDEIPVHLQRRLRAGKSIQDLAKELTHIEETKRDFIVPVDALSMNESGQLNFKNGEDHNFSLNKWSGSQVASFTDIPAQYFRRIQEENPKLLSENVNHGIKRVSESDSSKPRLVRTIDGSVRGFLSNQYRILDSYDLMNAVMPMLVENKFEVISCELTEKRLYLKTATQKIQGEVKQGDIVSYGVMISTSDVGAGSLRVEPYFLRLWCLNGAVSSTSFRKAHLGRSNAEREVQELLTDETKKLNDKAFFATVKDYMNHTMRPEVFKMELEKMQDATKREIKNFKLDEVVELAMKAVNVTGKEVKKGILEALADGNQNAGLTQWGLSNSFTAAAKMPELDYDTATDLERAGHQIITLSNSQWQRVAHQRH